MCANDLNHLWRERVRRQDHRGVARMDAGKFDVLQDAADDNRAVVWLLKTPHVGDAVHVHFGCVLKELIHQHRPFRRGFDGETHVMLELAIGINDLHRAAAEDETGADQYRVTEAPGDDQRFGLAGSNAVGRLWNVELAQHCREELPVLSNLDVLRRSADDIDAVFLQAQCEVERGLAAELGDRSPAFLALINVQHVFQRERLEKQLIARVIVRGDGLRIGIDHERLEPILLERERGVDATIIELDALADAVRPAAQNHHLFLVRRAHFVIPPIVSGVVIRCVRFKFCRAGIDQTIAGNDAKPLPFGADCVLCAAG